MNLYCRLPFGQFDQSNAYIQQVAEQMGRTPGSLSMKLCNLASLDSYHQQRGVTGLKGASNLDRKVWNDFQQDWTRMAERSEATFEALMKGQPPSETEPLKLPTAPEGPTEVQRKINVRRVQSFFRKAILGSYEGRCALTDLAVPELLIASHIIGWGQNESRRADPSNGICLNALHDKAFDRHLLSFDEDYRVILSSVLKSKETPEFQAYNFGRLEGKPLRLPHRFLPDPEALREHREIFSKSA